MTSSTLISEPSQRASAQPSRPRSRWASARRALLWLHRWIGLTFGLYFVVIGLSGSVLVYAHEIDGWLNPHLTRVAPTTGRAPLDRIVEAAQRVRPDLPISRMHTDGAPTDSYEFCLGRWGPDALFVYVDPHTALVLGERRLMESFVGFNTYLHFMLLLGGAGWYANAISGWIVALLLVTGLILWWPTTLRLLWSRLTVATGAGLGRLNYDLHNALGIYTLPLLLLITVTGAAFAFYAPIARIVYGISGATPPARATAPAHEAKQMMPLEALLQIAQAQSDGAPLVRFNVPSARAPMLKVRFAAPSDRALGHKLDVAVDARTGAILQRHDTRAASRTERGMNLILPLHAGTWGGQVVRALYCALGVAPLGLFISGAWLWWTRRRRRVRA